MLTVDVPLNTGHSLDAVTDYVAMVTLATMPLGDTEMLDRVRERLTDVEARAAIGAILDRMRTHGLIAP